jgi:hypothetical protein
MLAAAAGVAAGVMAETLANQNNGNSGDADTAGIDDAASLKEPF